METKTGNLLNTVEADEVVDIESNEPKFKISLTVQYFRTIDSSIIVHIEDCLSRCKFIDSFIKPVIIDKYSIRFSFVSENMELSDLCDLIQIIQIKHFPCRITNEAYKTLFNVLYNETNSIYPGYDINITSDAAVSHFLSFIMHYFPDANGNLIGLVVVLVLFIAYCCIAFAELLNVLVPCVEQESAVCLYEVVFVIIVCDNSKTVLESEHVVEPSVRTQ